MRELLRWEMDRTPDQILSAQADADITVFRFANGLASHSLPRDFRSPTRSSTTIVPGRRFSVLRFIRAEFRKDFSWPKANSGQRSSFRPKTKDF